ncbi:hypothetical protein OUZ56_013543 [Daphnia magna]|uniref:Uncharacterized protein n=1 Tax=Daphnia magna TaxID=35525 RepID=A0ABQ9Z680_9CRUS|nr:hypothetical protein OUZ56_013543 [Daphnia magna]
MAPSRVERDEISHKNLFNELAKSLLETSTAVTREIRNTECQAALCLPQLGRGYAGLLFSHPLSGHALWRFIMSHHIKGNKYHQRDGWSIVGFLRDCYLEGHCLECSMFSRIAQGHAKYGKFIRILTLSINVIMIVP